MNMLRKTMCAMTLGAMVIAPTVSTTAFAATPKAATEKQAAENLNQHLEFIHSLSADFEQTTKVATKNNATKKGLSAQHMNQTFKGTMKVERPGKFYWEVKSPIKQTIVTEGKTVWIHDPDLKQVVKKTLDAEFANTPALLLSGDEKQIMKSYRVTQPDQRRTYYKLYPKDQEGAFQSMTISFGAKNIPTLMILEDSLGQMTYVNFKNVKLNSKIPTNTFNFEVPKGHDVISE